MVRLGALLVIAVAVWFVTNESIAVAERGTAFVSADAAVDSPGTIGAEDHEGGESAAPGDNTQVAVQVWTVFAAGAAMGAGLVLYLLRLAMGWVKPVPPPQEESQH